jgi:hypothetical protein
MSGTQTVTTASQFLDSIGVNTKGSTYTDGYANSSAIIESLNYIGVTKVRDSFTDYGKASPVLDAMADAGIQFDFRVSYTLPAQGEAGLDYYLASLKAFMAEHPGAVLSVEGVNEANYNSVSYNGEVGIDAAVAFQKDLFTAIKADSALAQVTVVNLSLGSNSASDYAQVGNLGNYSDAANAHAYTLTGGTADGQLQNTYSLAESASVGDPLIVTEMGHTTLQSEPGIGTSETAQAKLLLSDLLLSYEDGAQTTYLYELFDNSASLVRGEKEGYFGIFNEDGTPKVAATALHNLTTILSFGDDGSATTTAAPQYSLSGTPANTHSMVMEKSGGVYDLVVWEDVSVWNDVTDTDINNPATTVTVNLGTTESVIRVYDPMAGLDPIAVYTNVSSFTIPLSDHPLVIEVGAANAVTEPVTTVAAKLTLTSAEFVAQLETLVKASGLQTVTLSDSHVLAVSSVETMAYIIKNDADLLAKIQGGFSFTVTYGEPTWTETQTFDAKGKLTLRTDYGLDKGVVISKALFYTDGTQENYHYGITGQSYATIHQVSNASGAITLIERLHADGTFDYREIHAADGSREYDYFNAGGKQVTDVVVATNGTTTTLSYDATTGAVTQQVVKQSNGDVLTTQYANGVKTVYAVTSHLGSKEQVTYDAKGIIVSDYILNADGSASNKTYAAGVLTKMNSKNADGTLDSWSYKIAGQSYVTIHQRSDSVGTVTLIERMHADGTFDYREIHAADGSREYVYYNATGKQTTDVMVSSTGETTTLTYDATSGAVAQQVVKAANGDILTTRYANGVKTLYAVTSHLGSKEQITYDAKGVIVSDYTLNGDKSAVNKTYTAGVLAKTAILNADGTTDNWWYGVTGQTYVTIHQANDKAGIVTLIERLHKDGSYDYREIHAADGSREFVYFTSGGKLATDVKIAKDGTNTTLTYDATSGAVAQQVVKATNGDILTTRYTNGVKTLYAVTSHLGSTEQIGYDVNGVIVSDYMLNADKSATNKTYTAGLLVKTAILNADGTTDNWWYGVTGQTYVTTHQANNKAGNITLIERLHKDGSYDYREIHAPSGAREYLYYNTAGKLLTDVTIAIDGTSTTLSYDVPTGKISQQVVKATNGDTLTTLYTAGVKTGYSTALHDGSKEQIIYDAKTGLMTNDYVLKADGSAVNKVYIGGALSKLNTVNADGTTDSWSYNVAGQTYVTLHQANDKAGNVTLIERLHADGSYDYRETHATDGSREYVNYTSAGKMLNDVTVVADGTSTTLNYGSTGLLASKIVKEADGGLLTTQYTSGVETSYSAVLHDGSKETISYDAKTGVILTDYLQNADGSASNKTYVAGDLTKMNVKNADGTLDNWAYHVTGQSYVTLHQTTDATGKITLVERFHQDGTFDYRELDYTTGGKDVTTYTSAGAVLNHAAISADGSQTVDAHLQDGTGDIRTDKLDGTGKELVRNVTHTNGQHDVSAYADAQTLTGGTGNDTFYFRTTNESSAVFQGGNDTVYNFNTDTTGTDHIVLSSQWAKSYSDLHMTQQGSDVLIQLDAHDSILVKQQVVANLQHDFFTFS